MTEAGIASGLWGDLYASLGERLPDDSWSVHIYHKPMVDWIWGGCALMALGGLLALADRRYRSRKKGLN
jgi:cytochrome c-type biogenesis protein CcmF